jgi:hypothetical protein
MRFEDDQAFDSITAIDVIYYRLLIQRPTMILFGASINASKKPEMLSSNTTTASRAIKAQRPQLTSHAANLLPEALANLMHLYSLIHETKMRMI